MKIHNVILNFNRGIISKLGLARQDIERLALSAARQNNYVPRVLGSMILRSGFGYTGEGTYDHAKAFHIPFIYSRSDTAILEATGSYLRIKINEVAITRPSVASSVTNGNFDTDVTSWTDDDETGSTSSWATGGYLSLVGTGYKYAKRYQQITVGVSDQSVLHAIRVVVTRGKATISLGSSYGAVDYLDNLVLEEGTHSLAITPTGDFFIHVSSNTKYATLVSSITIESAGVLTLPTPWVEASLPYIKYDQSGDVVYISCRDCQQMKIVRYGPTSWGILKFQPEDGPFRTVNTGKIQLTPSAISGDITLTASQALFDADHVGALFKVNSSGQYVALSATGEAQWSSYIRVTGVGTSRNISVVRSGTWVATVTLQRSIDEAGSWVDVTTYTTNGTTTYNDSLSNEIVYYRIGIDTGDYTSGTAVLSLEYSSGSIGGVCRVTAVASATSASAIALKEFGGTSASENWYEGEWSLYRGFPSAIALHEGRLCHAGLSKVFASVSDAYESYDPEVEGDSAPFTKNIPSGPATVINWLLSMKRLLIGAEQAEWYLRSSAYDEVLTLDNANLKTTSTQGSSHVQAINIDNEALFIQASGTRLFKTGYTVESDDYRSEDVSKLVPEFLQEGVVRTAVQRMPDTRVHCVLNDGTVALYIHDTLEDVKSWVTISTDGVIEDVVIMPQDGGEDAVYYCVKRTINGNTRRYLEKWALESECEGGNLNKQADSFILYQNSPASTITGLSHLEGEEVVVWADGVDLSPDDENGVQTTYTVSGGQISLGTTVENAVIGLPYKGQYQSVKIGMATRLGTSLLQKKIVRSLGIVAVNTHHKGVKYGSDFDTLDDLPAQEDFADVAADTVHTVYDEEMFEFDGDWDTDSRVCLESKAPRPANILACVIGVELHETHDEQ